MELRSKVSYTLEKCCNQQAIGHIGMSILKHLSSETCCIPCHKKKMGLDQGWAKYRQWAISSLPIEPIWPAGHSQELEEGGLCPMPCCSATVRARLCNAPPGGESVLVATAPTFPVWCGRSSSPWWTGRTALGVLHHTPILNGPSCQQLHCQDYTLSTESWAGGNGCGGPEESAHYSAHPGPSCSRAEHPS